MLATYEAFIARVEAVGFMALSPLLPGFPSLGGETPDSQWHTGLETDPWVWKDRAAEEKRLAFGCILGGHKGFVSARLYPLFYAAYHPAQSMPESLTAGTINQTLWQVWQLFEAKGVLNISQVRQMMGVGRKQSASAVDAAIQQLQREFYLTVDGNERKISAKGEFYGWPVNRYRRVVDWAPPDWLESVKDWEPAEASRLILDDGVAMSQNVARQPLARKMGLPA